MALTERLALLVSLDANGAIKGLNSVGSAADRQLGKAESSMDRMGQRFQKVGVGMLASSGLLATGLYKAGQSAADLEQAVGGTQAVFKDSSSTIDRYAKTAASNMGLSERAFREATTSIGGQLKGLGFNVDDAANKAVELTAVGADLAATYGGTTADAVAALGSAFRGEADPAERFNLRLNQNTVNAKAVALGLAETTSSVDANAKAQATLALITEQSSDAMGQFGREAGSASGQMQIANAEFENAKASLGEAVAPIIGEVAGKLADLSGGFARANEASGGFLSRMAAFGTIGLGAAGGLSYVVGKSIELRTHLLNVDSATGKATGGLSRLGKATAGLGFAGAVVGLIQMARASGDVTVNLDEVNRALADTNREASAAADESIRLADRVGVLDDTVKAMAETDVIGAEKLIERARAAGVAGDKIDELREITESKREADIAGAENQQQYATEMQEATGAAEGLTGKLDEQTDALGDLLTATLAQFDANIGYRQSIDDVDDKLTELNQLTKDGKAGTEEFSDALLDTESALLDQAAAYVRMWEDGAKANGETLTGIQRQQLYRDELMRLRDTLSPRSPLRAALDQYISTLNNVPRQISSDFILRFPGSQRVARAEDSRFGLRGNANGTSWWPGGLSLVGERGPEVVDLPRGSKVLDANKTAAMTGGGDTIVIPITLGGHLIDTLIVDANARTVRRGYAA